MVDTVVRRTPPPPARLLVGIAEPDDRAPRQYLLEAVRGLHEVGVEIQVAAFGDGPALAELAEVADVRRFAPLPPRSPSGLVQNLARRIGPDLEDRVHDARTRDDLAWIRPPDAVHLHGPLAVPLLRYVRDPSITVTTYAHHQDFSVAGLAPLDRQRLVDRTHRFLVDHRAARADLVAAGAQPDRVEPAPTELLVPDLPTSAAERARARSPYGLAPDAVVLAVPAVPDWVDWPDLTLALAWELEQRLGAEAPQVLWYGMDLDDDHRWPLELDIGRTGVANVHVTAQPVPDDDLCTLADAIVAPHPPRADLPEGIVATARQRYTPVLCWADDPLADEVRAWPGAAIPRPDVAAMATRVIDLACDTDARAAVRQQPWDEVLAELTRLTGIRVAVP